MNVVVDLSLIRNEQQDKVGQALASLCSAADHFYSLMLVSDNREQLANENDLQILGHALLQVQLAASLVEVRMIANEAMS